MELFRVNLEIATLLYKLSKEDLYSFAVLYKDPINDE